MTTEAAAGQELGQRALLRAALHPDTTPFDYIVVGSGAGGGSLAARLAEKGQRVLLLEAGVDPALPATVPQQPGVMAPRDPSIADDDRAVLRVPALHAAATEDAAMNWAFSVRHYEEDATQQADSKYRPAHDPSVAGQPEKGGILYPRGSALGGCTAHHAMIIVKPNDGDWNRIQALTGDDSWSASVMQGYFTRMEKCLYYLEYNGFLKKVLFFYRYMVRLLALLNPRWQLDRGGHGRAGWQSTSFISPPLIVKIAWRDWTFLRVLAGVIRFLSFRPGRLKALLRALLKLQLVQLLDPNFGNSRRGASGQLAFIPVATDGKHRVGLRERLMSVAQQYPERLVMAGGTLVTRVLFTAGEGNVPRACGVAAVEGLQLYQAGRAPAAESPSQVPLQYFARREVILAGGAFNSPQLLMLSGIGERQQLVDLQIKGPRDAEDREIAPIVDLPGVGRNLQDRYEVSVVSHTSAPFGTLNGVTFDPDNAADTALVQWRRNRSGLYTTNGCAVAFLYDSGATPLDQVTSDGSRRDPDMFVFGAPAAFRGYDWGWSRELLHATAGATAESRNLWSWVLLKAYTAGNSRSSVRLTSSSPFQQPQILFRSFEEGSAAHVHDLEALSRGIGFVREINHSTRVIRQEIQPGPARQDGSTSLKDWIRAEAWGHHACGTCRMGSDPWRPQVSALQDRNAVLDSRLRVHGVQGLRVVDASVFPRIPGYFIVTPVFMVGEKAADMLLADSALYPGAMQAAEAVAIARRRQVAGWSSPVAAAVADPSNTQLPDCTVGVALSGGGVRSATFALGMLQSLAARNRLRDVDVLSTVSGGGYIGSFLGRLFMRMQDTVADPLERVQATLTNMAASELWWLRRHASYLVSAGRSDLQETLGVAWRNLISVHAVIGFLLLSLFAGLRYLGGATAPPADFPGWLGFLTSSPWWIAPGVLLVGAAIPALVSYWLAPKSDARSRTPLMSLLAWLALASGALCLLRWPAAQPWALLGLGSLLLSWLWLEAVRHFAPVGASPLQLSSMIRNRLSRAFGVTVIVMLGTILWAVLDSVAYGVSRGPAVPIVGSMVVVNLLLPAVRSFWERVHALNARVLNRLPASLARTVRFGIVAYPLAILLIFALDVLAHAAFNRSDAVGIWVFCFAFVLSLALGRSTRFANHSGLQAVYSARLARTYLGASNPARVATAGAEVPPPIIETHPQDDMAFADYHPELRGGPLHLVNVCVNENADTVTGRHLPEDKGLAMCVGPAGISVGVRHHALWKPDDPECVQALPIGANPESFHVLGRDDMKPAAVEPLRLSQWMAISGAAFTTGSGKRTNVAMSLFHGLINLRLGYWWNTGIDAGKRPGRFPPTLFNRIVSLPGLLFRTQKMLLNEWRAYFPGPAARFWYLSDGAHFDNTGLYELVRRRVELIIAIDMGEDPQYRFDDMADLSRQVRLDFGAVIEWVDPEPAGVQGDERWSTFTSAGVIPEWIRAWLNPAAIGARTGITRGGVTCAALARVRYPGTERVSWLVLVKPTLCAVRSSLDLRCYADNNPQFPNQSTLDQFFDDQQWESYRLLGEVTGSLLFKSR